VLGHETLPPVPPLPVAFVELCSATELAPSIRRSLSRTWATVDWLFAQPLRLSVGTLPGGVLDATAPALPAVGAAALAAEALELELAPPAAPTAPVKDVIETFAGSTRPSSWTACAQSKRELTS
jgi:hypothetical protein